MTIKIKTTSGKIEIDCTEEECAGTMDILGNWESGNLRISLSNGKKDIILNHRHFVEAYADYSLSAPTVE